MSELCCLGEWELQKRVDDGNIERHSISGSFTPRKAATTRPHPLLDQAASAGHADAKRRLAGIAREN